MTILTKQREGIASEVVQNFMRFLSIETSQKLPRRERGKAPQGGPGGLGSAQEGGLQVGIGILMDSDVPVHISGLVGSNNGTVRGCRIQSEIVWNDEVCTEPEPAIALQHYAPVAAYNGGTIADCTLQTGVNALGNVYGIVEENYGTVTNCDVDLNTNSCTNVSGLAYRNWEAIDGCWVSGQADTVTEFCCIARQNYAPITNCRFDMWINGPAGQGCSWSISGFEGDGHSFDDSNTVNISELNNRAGSGGVGNP